MAAFPTRILAGLALALAPTPALMAQERAPETPSAQGAEGEIIVEGYTEKDVRSFLRRALVTTGNVVARRSTPICIGIDNAPESLSEPIRRRILANLAALGIETAAPGCRANAVIVFHPDAHAFVNWLARKDGGTAFSAFYRPEKRRLIDPVRQAYAWHHIPAEAQRLRNSEQAPGGLGGDAIGFPPVSMDTTRGRIMTATTAAESTYSFAVIDSDAIVGLTHDQVADWLTMQMLVETRPQDGDTDASDAGAGASSILGLFTATGHNPAAPPELSRLDRAILAQIYGGTSNFLKGAIRQGAARRLLAETAAAEAEPEAAATDAAPPPAAPRL